MWKHRIILVILLLGIGYTSAITQQPIVIGDIHFSPDGNFIAGSGPRTLQVWEANSSNVLFSSQMDTSFDDVAWSPDSSRVVTASSDGYIRIWNVTDPAIPLDCD